MDERTQAEGEAGSMQGARCRTRSLDPRITPWAEGGAKPLSHPGCPILGSLHYLILFYKRFIYLKERERKRERECMCTDGGGREGRERDKQTLHWAPT